MAEQITWIRRGRSGYLHAFRGDSGTGPGGTTVCGILKTNAPRERWPRTWGWPDPDRCPKCIDGTKQDEPPTMRSAQ